MPSVLESAKEAGYTALGLNVLMFDEVAERTADVRKRVDEQLDIARDHGRKAQEDFQKQADDLSENVKKAMPFDVDAVTDAVQDRIQPFAKRSFELAEPAWKRIAEISPAPFDEMVTDGVARMRDLVLDEEPAAEAAPKKKATRKPAAKKTTAKKSTKKAAAKK